MTDLRQLTRDIIAYQLAKTSMEEETAVVRVVQELKSALEFLYTSFSVESYPHPRVQTSEELGLLFRTKEGFSSRNLTLLTHKKLEYIDLFVVHPNHLDRESSYEFMTRSRKVVIQDWQERNFLSHIAHKLEVHGAEQRSEACWQHKHKTSAGLESGLPVLNTYISTHLPFYWGLNEKDIEKLRATDKVYHLFEAYQHRRICDVYQEASKTLEEINKKISKK